jgi:SWI/SNF-related matrix-associated actin-dependent regulator of chromatin subfamily A3
MTYILGLVGAGEEVSLVREPGNRYDRCGLLNFIQNNCRDMCSRNAIQVKNIGMTQVGHIPRNIAAKLAPLLDRNLITVEGVMLEGNCEFLSWQ